MSDEVVRDAFGNPMLKVTVCQSEKINTGDYGNAELGPVAITVYVLHGTDEQVMAEIRRLRRLCDESISEDRQTLWNELQARAAQGQPNALRPANLGRRAG